MNNRMVENFFRPVALLLRNTRTVCALCLVFLSMSARAFDATTVARQHPASSAAALTDSIGEVYEVAGKMPEYPGGQQAMIQFLSENVKYPADALKADAQGRVLIGFIVETNGTLSGAHVLKSVHPSLDSEALRVVRMMPRWTPGMQDGKAVRVKYTVPVTFKIVSEGAESETPSLAMGESGVPASQPEEAKNDSVDDEVYMVVETMPEFPGGTEALMRYLSRNVKYPSAALANGIQGAPRVSFTVNKDGCISDVTVTKSVHPLLDAEAVRVMRNMPKWKPGMQRGKLVRVTYNVPVAFRIH
ncbi:MAG: energy transducer TonB [Bacteroides sp.]|nr:energy transducer TonB [Bacteroides sp.]MCM1419834.1 energy transducer TonB [Bacteroides sp.]